MGKAATTVTAGILRGEADKRAAAEMPRACPSCGTQLRDPELKGTVALGTERGPNQTSSWPGAALGAGLSGGRCPWTQESGHSGWLVHLGLGKWSHQVPHGFTGVPPRMSAVTAP